jgi:hypothetical protein
VPLLAQVHEQRVEQRRHLLQVNEMKQMMI